MNKFSIRQGFDQVQNKDLAVVKSRIMCILGIGSRAQWSAYLRGKVEPKVSQAMEIEKLFYEYGITDIFIEN